MDLNHLIHREGEERLRAVHAASDSARDAHVACADMFRGRIDVRRRRALRDRAGPRPALRPPAR